MNFRSEKSEMQSHIKKTPDFILSVMALVLSSIFFFYTPRIGDKLRLQDFTAILNLLVVFMFTYKRMFRLPKVFFFELVSVIYITTITIIFCLVRNNLDALLLVLRDLFYFSNFALIYSIKLHFPKVQLNAQVSVFVGLTCLFASYIGFTDILLSERGYYGIGYFTEKYNSAGSSVAFFLIGVLSIACYLDKNRIFFLIGGCASFLLCCFTGSRTGMLMVVIFAFTFVFLIFNFRTRILIICIFIFPFLLLLSNRTELAAFLWNYEYDNEILRSVVRRFSTILTLETVIGHSRFESWSRLLERFDIIALWGNGRGSTHLVNGQFSLGLGSDSGYLKTLIEYGIIGSVFYYGVFMAVCFKVYRLIDKKAQMLLLSFISAVSFAELSYEYLQTAFGGYGTWLSLGLVLLICSPKIIGEENKNVSYSSSCP